MLVSRRSLHATPLLRRWMAPQAIIKGRRSAYPRHHLVGFELKCYMTVFTTPPPNEPVNLAYDLWGPSGVQSKKDPILILHGLLYVFSCYRRLTLPKCRNSQWFKA